MTRLLALTRGDPSGVGLEIAFKAWIARNEASAPFILVADVAHCRLTAEALGLDVPIQAATPADAPAVFSHALPVLPLELTTCGVPGKPDIVDAPGTIASMEKTVELVRRGEAAAVVTLPLSKKVLHDVGFRHPGQTEFMGELAQRHWGHASKPVMLLWSSALAVIPMTVHVPLSAVPGLVTATLVKSTIRTASSEMKRRFHIPAPRIAVAGLNPHSGEGGDMGHEEIDVIAPALADLREEGIDVSGPHPADTLFHAAARRRFDVCVTMYHDQALIPIKTIAFDSAVNVTLGLPFIRVSPDHGTAFDIAGKGVADPSSLLAAIELATNLGAPDQIRSAA